MRHLAHALMGAVFEPLFSPRDIDENLLHGAGGGFEEMPALRSAHCPRDLQPCLVDKSRGLKRLPEFSWAILMAASLRSSS
jgi:hypothetical protein